MKRVQLVTLLVIIALITAGAQAAFMVEAHSSGMANGNFSYNWDGAISASSTPTPSEAYGVTATNSVFGGGAVAPVMDTYTFSFTPGIDADNLPIPADTDMGNENLSSGLVGNGTGYYNVYITWPATTNADPAGCRITITSDGSDIVIDPINVNNGGTGSPGANNGWYLIASDINLTAGNTYTVTQEANNNSYVSMRSHGVMWEAVSEPMTFPDTTTLWMLAEQWLDEGLPYPPEPGSVDFNGDTRIDFKDFAILANNGIRIGGSGEYRCIWVDIWDPSVRTASQCDALVQLCRNNNINTVIPEVRVYGDAYYQSNLEPRGHRLINDGFDPLGYLIDKAHDTSGGKKYIEVHAWFVMQRSTSSSVPLDDLHVLSQHFEYVMRDSSGNTGSDWYLDPGHPGALDHNVNVILDCLSNYNIDGINLDYIRYPGSTWGYNLVSIARFNAFYGKSGQPSLSDPDWSDWRRECVTHQVKKVYVKSLMIDPDVVVTTDTINWGSSYSESNYTSSSAYASNFQDWVGWLQEGIIDYNALMNYVAGGSNSRYNGWTDLSLANDDKRGSIIGIGAYMQPTVQDSMDQLLYARNQGAAGLNIYDWGGEVNANTIGETANDFYRELKAQLYPEWVDPPAPVWKVWPTKGIFEGYLTEDGFSVDHGSVEIEGQPETRVNTDGTGWYAILEVEPGSHVLRFSVPGSEDILIQADTLFAGQIMTVNADTVN